MDEIERAGRRQSLLHDKRVKSVTKDMNTQERDAYIEHLINEMSYDERSVTSAQIKRYLDNIPTNRERADYIVDTLEKIRGGHTHVAHSTLGNLYNSLSDACAHIRHDEHLAARLEVQAAESENAKDRMHAEYFRHLSKKLRSPQEYSVAKKQGIAGKVAAAFIVGAGVFAMRTMTGNVAMNITDISAEGIGSILIGILAVGSLLILISRLTAKP